MGAVQFGPGKKDDVDGKFHIATWDSTTKEGTGIATTWDDATTASGVPANHGGLYCSLPMPGSPHTTGTPIPKFPWKTKVRVSNPKTGKSVDTELIDIGPQLVTGAPIDLTADVKKALGQNLANLNFYVTFKVLA